MSIVESWKKTLDRIDLRMPVPMGFDDLREHNGFVFLTLWLDVPDAETREPRRVSMVRDLPEHVNSESDRVQWLRDFVLDALVHELNEGFRVDGKLLRDPHLEIGCDCPDHGARCRISHIVLTNGFRYGCAEDRSLRVSPRVWSPDAA